MTQPYRVAAEMPAEAADEETFEIEPFQKEEYPNCPVCHKGYSQKPKACSGKRSFWTSRSLCPQTVVHLHPECGSCGHKWMMASKKTEAGTYR